MGSGLRLVGLVASLRMQVSLLLPASLMSCIPAYAWGAHQLAPVGSVGIALILFTAAFLVFLKARRPWYESRLEQLTPPPPGAELVDEQDTFDLCSRSLTTPLLAVLLIGVVVSYEIGVPVGMALTGLAAAMLVQSRWLAAEEKRLDGRLMCLHTPVHVAAADPNGPAGEPPGDPRQQRNATAHPNRR